MDFIELKVLHCISTASIGGIERLVIELAIAQKEADVQVAIMLDQKKGQFLDEIVKRNIPIHVSNIKSGFEFNFSKLNQLIKVFNQFEIIHLHNFSLLRSLAALNSKSKVVYTIHGLSKGIRKENILKYIARETLKNYFLNKVDYIVANSQFTLQGAIKDYKLKTQSKAILNGSSLKNPPIQLVHNKKNQLVIGLVSRFTARKRIDRLIESFALFIKKGGDGKLILVGDGQTYDSIVKLVESKRISNKVEFIGYSKEVTHFYQQFDICVFPSEHEPFGLVAVEAYNFGLPVLSYEDSGGLIEIVMPLEPENVVKSNEELANRLLFYLTNRIEFNDDKKKRRIEYVKEKFSIQRMEREYFEVYQSLING